MFGKGAGIADRFGTIQLEYRYLRLIRRLKSGAIWTGSHTEGGWLVGAGIEYAFRGHWTGKLEYNYLGLINSSVSTPRILNVRHNIQMLKVGLNYQFGDHVPVSVASGSARRHSQLVARFDNSHLANSAFVLVFGRRDDGRLHTTR